MQVNKIPRIASLKLPITSPLLSNLLHPTSHSTVGSPTTTLPASHSNLSPTCKQPIYISLIYLTLRALIMVTTCPGQPFHPCTLLFFVNNPTSPSPTLDQVRCWPILQLPCYTSLLDIFATTHSSPDAVSSSCPLALLLRPPSFPLYIGTEFIHLRNSHSSW